MKACRQDVPILHSHRVRGKSGASPHLRRGDGPRRVGRLFAVGSVTAVCFAAAHAPGRPLAAQTVPGQATAAGATAPDGRARQSVERHEVRYPSLADGYELSGTLDLPFRRGAAPGVLLLTVAGADPIVERLLAGGAAVLTPVRRGFVDVEPLLRATYADLAADARSGLDYLAGRPEVEANALAVVAQADDAPAAIAAVAAWERPVPLVLLAPPVASGVEGFRREQRFAAERARWTPEELRALDDWVDRIVEVALSESPPYVREYRLDNLRAVSPVQLPRSAAFPADERQMHFFASPLWHDRLAFDPSAAYAEIRGPVMVLIGADDANTPTEAYVRAARGHLDGAETRGATVCVLPGRTRHAFSEAALDAITAWLGARIGAGDPTNAWAGTSTGSETDAGPRPGLNRPERDPAAGC